MSTTPDQQRRYLTDPVFHARVEIVARALWSAISRFPFEKLIDATKRDLIGYAIAAVEALEAFDNSTPAPPPASAEPW